MKEGGSSWKIKSKDGKMISTKKEEHTAICNHMNIPVDKYKVSWAQMCTNNQTPSSSSATPDTPSSQMNMTPASKTSHKLPKFLHKERSAKKGIVS